MVYSLEQIKKIVAPIAEKYALPAMFLFGSYARGTATESSDIDLLVDTTGTNLTTMFTLGALYSDLEDALKKEIDLVLISSLQQPATRQSDIHFRENLEKERVSIYEAA